MNRRLGIVASAGGSVIFEVLPYLRANGIELVVATDRACGIEERCAAQGILHQRFAYHERDAFSQAVQHYFVQHEVALVLLYYTRFVGAPLYDVLPTLNIHPSLLPQFTGLNPLARQLAAHVPLIGATLHQVLTGTFRHAGEDVATMLLAAHASRPVEYDAGVPDELASMVEELITNSYMNAEVVRVDGGIRMPPK